MTQRAVLINDTTGQAGPHPGGAKFQRRIEAAATAALAGGFKGGPELGDVELSITLVEPEKMQTLNREYHGVDAPTDVLTFHLDAMVQPGNGPDPVAKNLLGDLYVCPAVASSSARHHGIEVAEEVLRLVIHGVLHLLGHTHPEDDSRYASEMFRLQERVLQRLLDEVGRAAE